MLQGLGSTHKAFPPSTTPLVSHFRILWAGTQNRQGSGVGWRVMPWLGSCPVVLVLSWRSCACREQEIKFFKLQEMKKNRRESQDTRRPGSCVIPVEHLLWTRHTSNLQPAMAVLTLIMRKPMERLKHLPKLTWLRSGRTKLQCLVDPIGDLDRVMSKWGGALGRSQPNRAPISVLPLNCSCVTLDKKFCLPGPQFPHLRMEGLG